jgi:retron-type reverse transcriptase
MTDNSSIDLSLTNIWESWRAFRAGKKPSRDILAFESELELNLIRLCYDLNHGIYRHGSYNYRIVNEKKRRDIAVAQVRDRVVHRLLYDYLTPIVNRRLDYDVWSCRMGKGLHKGLLRTRHLISKYDHGCVWRADIVKFFDSIDHEVLRVSLKRHLTDQKAVELLDIIINSYKINSQPALRQAQGRPVSSCAGGIPIGNLIGLYEEI